MTVDTLRRSKERPRKFPEAVAQEPAPVFDATTPRASVRRMTHADIDTLGPWIVPLLQEHFGDASIAQVNGWLRGWMLGNDTNIACTDNAVALAQIAHDPMDPTPVVSEVFTFSKVGFAADGIALYDHFVAWGKLRQASEFRFSKANAVVRDMLKVHFPKLKWMTSCFLELD